MSEQAMAPIAAPASETPVTEAPQGTEIHTQKAPEAPKPIDYHEVKVNGAIKRFTIDELKAKATLGEAAREKFEQAAKMSKDYGSLKEKLRTNFLEAIQDKDLGLTKDQIRTQFEKWYHENYIEPEMLNEDQRRARELERRVKQYEDEKAKQDEEFKLREQQTLETHATQEVQQQIIEAIEKANLPRTQESARKIAYFMKQNLKYNFDAPMEVIVQQVKDSDRQALQAQIQNAPVEYIIEMFGKDIINKLRKHDLKQLEAKFNKSSDAPKQQQTKSRSEEPKRMSDVDSYFRKMRQGK